MNIDEMIADAQAEEKTRENIAERIDKAFATKRSDVIEISLGEYLTLKQRSLDMDRLMQAIINNLELGYHKDELRLNGEEVVETFKALFRPLHDEILKEHQDATPEE